MRCCCRSFTELLPQDAERWLGAADAYRAGEVAAGDLLAACLEAWEHLGAESCDFASPRVNAVRAVLFLLFPDDDPDLEDASLVVSHFVDFCEGVGVSLERQGRCLAESYGLPLGGRADT